MIKHIHYFNNSILIIGCLFFSNSIFSQDCLDITVPDDITICEAQNISLDGTINGDFLEFEWTGSNGFSDNQNLNTSAFTTSTTTYTLTAIQQGDVNLVTNGDFENGNTGFTSEYAFNPNTNTGGLSQGSYNLDVVYPFNWSGANCPSIDGTTMMVVNAAVVPNVNVYCTDVIVSPNTEYIVTADLLTINNPPPIFQFSVNGLLLGNIINGLPQCNSNQFFEIWDSGPSTTATICIVNQSTAAGGNDFAIDNVSFTELCRVEKEFEVTLEIYDVTVNDPADIDCDNPFVDIIATSSPIQGQQYQWSTNDGDILADPTNSTITALSPGTYDLIVTDQNGCTMEESVTIGGSLEVPIFNIIGPFVLDCDNPSIFLETDITGTNLAYTWILPDGTEVNTPTLDATNPGLYNLTITNTDNNCFHNEIITVQLIDWDPVIFIVVDDQLDCNNQSVEVIFQFDESFDDLLITLPDGSTVSTFALTYTATQIGTYDYTFSFGNCVNSGSFTVDGTSDIDFSVSNTLDTLTCSLPVSTLSANIVGDIDSIIWMNEAAEVISTDLSTDVTTPGTYVVEIISDSGCSANDTIIIFEDTTIPTASFTLDTITCLNPNGGFDITSTSAASVLWIGNNETSTSISPSFNQGGDYSLILLSANGCNDTIETFLPVSEDFPEITSEVIGIDCNSPEGQINISSSIANSNFDWTGPGTFSSSEDSILVSLTGTYVLSVTTPDGCILSDSFSVTIDTIRPSLTVTLDSLTCVNPSITPEINTNGEIQSWTFPDNTMTTNISPDLNIPGEYIVTAQSGNGCTTTINVLLEAYQDADPFNITSGVLTCAETSTSISVDNQSLDYTLFDGNTTTTFVDSIMVNEPGEYFVTGTNDFGCDTTLSIVIELETPKPIFDVDFTNLVCNDTTTFLIVNNPDLQYTLVSDMMELAFTDSILITGAGVYSIIGVNQNGCDSTITLDIDVLEEVPEFNFTFGELNCINTDVSIITSDPGLNYSLQFGSNTFEFSDSVIVDQEGIYKLTVRDERGCEVDTTFEILRNEIFPEITLTNEIITCNNTSTNIINTTGDFLNSTYSWTGQGITSDQEILNTENGGWFSLEVTNQFGCTSLDSIFVEEDLETPDISIVGDTLIECHENSEVLTIISSTTDVTPVWMDNLGNTVTAFDIDIAEEGHFFATIINNINGCINFDTTEVSIRPGPALDLLITAPLCPGEFGSVSINGINGGQEPYDIFLDDDLLEIIDNIEIEDFNEHVIHIQDENGCTVDTSFTIFEIEELELDITIDENSNQINILPLFDEGSIATIEWTPNETLSCIECLNPLATPSETTDYVVTITTIDGCVISASVRVEIDLLVGVTFPNVFSPNGDGVNDLFTIYEKFESVELIETLIIFDRWGNKVFDRRNFEPSLPELGWNGTHKGIPAESSVYVFFTEVIYINNSRESISGTITLAK